MIDYNFIYSSSYKTLIMHIIQIITVYNAIIMGWKVEKIGRNKYLFSKKLEELTVYDGNLDFFADKIISFNPIKNKNQLIVSE